MAVNYLFVLGRDEDLSLLEVESFFPKNSIKIVNKRFVLVNTDKEFNVDDFGGITKIFKEVKSFDEIIFDMNKLSYSYYGPDDNLKKLKKRFKEEKIKASFRAFDYDPRNLDFEFAEFDKKLFANYQISKPKNYKKRDETRPRFDAKKVISIRMAKILINLSKAEKEILDPFCGSGTILQEGLLKGLNVIGMDHKISEVKANINWLRKNYEFKAKYTIIKGDSRGLGRVINKVECVVTEPYMGPYLKKLPVLEDAQRTAKRLYFLYRDLFRELNKVVEKRIVIIIPTLRTYKKDISVGFERIVSESGFRVVESRVKIPVVYNLPNAKIFREIWVLERFK